MLSKGDWHSWDDCLEWLLKDGLVDDEFTTGEVLWLIDDVERKKQDDVIFGAV
jgi:hypothetical protein